MIRFRAMLIDYETRALLRDRPELLAVVEVVVRNRNRVSRTLSGWEAGGCLTSRSRRERAWKSL